MDKYSDYKKDKSKSDLTEEEFSKIKWTKYKIIVPNEKDKTDLMDAFRHIHDSDVNSDFVVVNQLMHEYLEGSNIIVDDKSFKD